MTNIIKVAVSGACGRMGKEVIKAVNSSENMEVVAAIDITNVGNDIGAIAGIDSINVKVQDNLSDALAQIDVDAVVDFTTPDKVYNNAKTIIDSGARPVIGTTGLSKEQIDDLKKLSNDKSIGVFIAPNFTIGAVLMMKFAQMAAKYFDNAEIIELHHNKKLDAPSGTAVKTAQMMAIENENFATGNVNDTELLKGSRGGVAESNIHIHSVRMPGYMASQEVLFGSPGQVLKIRHDSVDRSCYMPGVILGIKHVVSNNDFTYGLENIL